MVCFIVIVQFTIKSHQIDEIIMLNDGISIGAIVAVNHISHFIFTVCHNMFLTIFRFNSKMAYDIHHLKKK